LHGEGSAHRRWARWRHAIRYRRIVPTVRVEAGLLMSYGTTTADMFRQVGMYTDSILKGAKPAALAAVQSTKFEFVINLPTARALGIDLPPSLLARADEMIE
jgi:putative ABC transport system substrate-binding protein